MIKQKLIYPVAMWAIVAVGLAALVASVTPKSADAVTPFPTRFEEASFTPTISYSQVAPTALTYSAQLGQCYRNQNVATCSLFVAPGVAYDPGPAAGDVTICGLPWYAMSDFSQSVRVGVGVFKKTDDAIDDFALVPQPGTRCLSIQSIAASGAPTALTAGQVLTASALLSTGTWLVDG